MKQKPLIGLNLGGDVNQGTPIVRGPNYFLGAYIVRHPYGSPEDGIETEQQRPVRSDQKKALWIEVRNSDTGERTVLPYAAPIPRTRAERELFLNQLVPQIFPGAKLRTYGGGVGTFICGALLIAAHYGAVRDDAKLASMPERQLEPVTDVGQGSLFAA